MCKQHNLKIVHRDILKLKLKYILSVKKTKYQLQSNESLSEEPVYRYFLILLI